MKIINDKLRLEQGDIIKLINGTEAEFLNFNPWDEGLVHVKTNGVKQCLFNSEIDVGYIIKALKANK